MEPHTITDVVAQKNALSALIALWKGNNLCNLFVLILFVHHF